MASIKDYFCQKYERKINVSPKQCDEFLKNIKTPSVTPEESTYCDIPITKVEINNVLGQMDNNKSPGNDGLPKEFYVLFINSISDILIDCYHQSLMEGNMTASQRQAIITLIEKPGKDNTLLKSWRPVSLLNVDLKNLSKIIANTLQKVLPTLIGPEQNAFVKGRYIGDTVRLISDIMFETKAQNTSGILFGADFAAAFDSVDHVFMLSVLKRYSLI